MVRRSSISIHDAFGYRNRITPQSAMVSRSVVLARKSKVHRPFSPSSVLRPYLLQRPVLSHSFASSASFRYPQGINILNHKDWLSPTQVVNIFQTLEDPNSVLPAFYQLSKRKDYKPNEALYSVVIEKLAAAKDFDGIENVMERIKLEKLCRLSDGFFYKVIRIWGNVAGRINRAIETLFDMPNYNCWPTVKTFNFVLNLLVNTRQFDIIHEVYLGASKLGIEIDACCLNIIIKGLCKNGNIDDAFVVLDEFPKQNCVPNVLTFSTIMHGLCSRGRIDEVFVLLERMEREGVEPDAIAFNILISGLRKQGRAEESIKLFDRMRFKGCEPNTATYQEVLYSLLDAKKLVEAKEFMNKMIIKGENPGFDSYKFLIHGFCDQNLVGDVDWVLKQMVRHGFVPKMGMWKMIVECMFSGKDNISHETIFAM